MRLMLANSQPAMIFLKDNVLLERPLKFEDVKPRLLGKLAAQQGCKRREMTIPLQAIGEHVPGLF